jgi:hypothetical protein
MGGAAMSIMFTSFTQAQSAVDGQANFRRVFVFLAIVLPPADRTQRQRVRGCQGSISAAWTSKTKRHQSLHGG